MSGDPLPAYDYEGVHFNWDGSSFTTSGTNEMWLAKDGRTHHRVTSYRNGVEVSVMECIYPNDEPMRELFGEGIWEVARKVGRKG